MKWHEPEFKELHLFCTRYGNSLQHEPQLISRRFALPPSRCDADAVAFCSVSSFDEVDSELAAIHPITFKAPKPPPSSTRPSVASGAPLPPATPLRKRWP